MGGGNKKRFNKSKTRILKQGGHGSSSAARALFVNGGVLSDWSAVDSPPSSRGRNSNSNHSKNGNNSKSVSRSGISSGENQRRGGNAFVYVYPAVETPEASLPDRGTSRDENLEDSHPIVLVDSKDTQILAYLDQTPVMGQNVEYTYDYSTGFSLDNSEHRGLGFSFEAEATASRGEPSSKMAVNEGSSFVSSSPDEEMEADIDYVPQPSTEMSNDNDFLKLKLSPGENPGFLCIGGVRIYTQDMSDEDDGEEFGDEDQGEELLDKEILESSVSEDSNGSDTDELFDSDSDIDEEVAADYYEGIGGSDSAIDVDTLSEQILDVSGDDSCSGDIIDDTLEKLGGIALQEASQEYGKKKPRPRRKSLAENCKSRPAIVSSVLDNLMLVKDPRNISGRKKDVAKFPRSWPYEAQKSKRFGKFSGDKKKIRKEAIALKRRERMIRRGVDLEKINLKLEKMVLDGLDMLSFQPMHSRDCSQVQRLAAIYRLRSGCQGSGKKRFVTVMRTQHTCMPSSLDRDRLDKLIGAFDGDDDFTVTNLKSAKGNRSTSKMASKGSGSGPQELQSLHRKSSKDKSNKSGSKEESKKRIDRPGSYAAQPVSFVSSGIMQSETVETRTNDKKDRDENGNESTDASSSSKYGAFEQHTTGFGSKMMAKMGFIEGGGLGSAGQGMIEPIEVIQRPKSLGLGAKAPDTCSTLLGMGAKEPETSTKLTKKGSHQFGAFEKHTKGFGSKMMAKMGFIEGRGLGRDSQGIVNPLSAVRLPKSRGLGANN